MRYSDIFFDLDDTIWDTVGNARECLADLYAQFEVSNYYSDFNEFYAVYMANNQRLWQLYSKHQITKDMLGKQRFEVPFEQYDDVTDKRRYEMNEYYLTHICRKNRTIDGTFELLDYLKIQYNLHIISNGFTELQFKKIESAGLTPYFDKVILSDAVGVNKPHPNVFTYALDKANALREESMMIGDNLFADIEGAAASGIDQIWFNPQRSAHGDIEPTYVVSKLSQIQDIL